MKKKIIKKGEWGYINQTKVLRLLGTLAMLLLVAIILYTGFIQYDTTKNVFTVMAVVSVIPTAKIAVSYLVIMKYHSCEKSVFEAACAQAPDSIVLSDLLISSTEKVFQADIAVIRDNSVFMYCENLSESVKEKEAYVRKVLETEAKVTSVKIFSKQDIFLKNLASLNGNNPGKSDETIQKVLCIYSL